MAGQLTAFDIGESMVKIVSVSGGQVKKAVCAQMPDNLVSDGVILFNDAMADTLKSTLSSAGMGKGKAAVILPDRLVFARNVTVPPMTEAQLKYNLPFEFKDYLTQEKSQYYFDYSVQEIVKEGEEPKEMRLFACTALKETIEQYRTVFRLAGCKLVNAIPEEVAYGSLVARYMETHPEEADQDYCLVDVGYRGLRMYIYRGSEFRNRRTVDLGLYNLEQEIADTRGVDIHVAHTHLMTNYQEAHPALSEGGMKFLYAQGDTFAIARFWKDDILVGVISKSDKEETIRLPLAAAGGKTPEGKTDLLGTPIIWEWGDAHSILFRVVPHSSYLFRCTQ